MGLSPRRLRVVLLVLAGIASACSLVLPFDDYREPNEADATAPDSLAPGPEPDGAADGAADDADADDAACPSDRTSDPLNCGACGRVCADGGACAGGQCPITTVVEEPRGRIERIVATGGPFAGAPDCLYYTVSTGAVGRIALPSGPPEYAPAPGAAGFLDVAPNGRRGVLGVDGSILGLAPSAFDASPVGYSTHAGLSGLFASASANRFFWSDEAGVGTSAFGKPDATAVIGPGAAAVGFYESAGRLLWATADGAVWVVAASAPDNPAPLFNASASGLTGVAATKTHIYLAQRSQGVLAYSWDGAASVDPAVTLLPMAEPLAIVATSSNVWVIDRGGTAKAELRRYPPGGGAKVVLASGFVATAGLAVKDEFIYFADGPRILRTTR